MAMGGATLAPRTSASTDGPARTSLSEDKIRLVCTGACRHPTNAAKVFKWGREKWRDEFEEPPFPTRWTFTGTGSIGQTNGMFTITPTTTTAQLIVWPAGRSARKGRWEARVRAVEKRNATGERFRFNWELAPSDGSNCEASKIILASYKVDDTYVTGAVRTLPNNEFQFKRKRDLQRFAWHTYAVEVTKKHIAWFVDRKVMRRERRPEALAGTAFRPQFVLTGVPGATMRESYMQMDWVRFYTLKRKNAKPIKQAPPMLKTTYAGGC